MKYSGIIYNDIANGTGVRTSLFVSGCRNNCPGCFNKEAQSFIYGNEFTDKEVNDIINSVNDYFHSGISILGGEPMEPENAICLLPFVEEFKNAHPDKTIWLYTGYTYEFINSLPNNDYRKMLLKFVDVLVDGRFIEDKKDPTLPFRGSSNQRLIDVYKSLDNNNIELLKLK